MQMDYLQKGAIYKYLKKIMSLPFLPVEEIPAEWERLKAQVITPALLTVTEHVEINAAMRTEDENGVTLNLMDGEANGVAAWLVKPPAFRSQQLTALCGELQDMLEAVCAITNTEHKQVKRYSDNVTNWHTLPLKNSNKYPKETTGQQGSSANSRPWPAPLDEPGTPSMVFEEDSTEPPPKKDNETKDPLRKTRQSSMKRPRASLKGLLTRPTYMSGSSGAESDARGQTVRMREKAMKKMLMDSMKECLEPVMAKLDRLLARSERRKRVSSDTAKARGQWRAGSSRHRRQGLHQQYLLQVLFPLLLAGPSRWCTTPVTPHKTREPPLRETRRVRSTLQGASGQGPHHFKRQSSTGTPRRGGMD
ncbi:Hypp8248 [Branchiostoma lanceolatum]|uniref:Hypp8248 protein n=1 Tax=Branchiostoma lanceolatum TaxID=7740 RepID=A0A8J9Z7L2_BRALA|nr:Hypp8248 [Branchiostoma lanceolatum]